MNKEPIIDRRAARKPSPVWRAIIEVCFIAFLYYSNLLMGEYEHSGQGPTRGLVWAVHDIFTAANLIIAVITAVIGYLIFEWLRKKY
jgi:hypothetical protein